jgi:alpha-N-arabinofuranosidase
MERNADLVIMECYAPLFVNVNPGGMQWQTDLVGYDTASAYGSPAYWAQQMFSTHHGSDVLSVTVANIPSREWQASARRGSPPGATPAPHALTPATPMPRQLPLMFFDATRDSATGKIYVKVVNHTAAAQAVHISLSGMNSVAPTGKMITLSATSLQDTNSITEPNRLVPVTADVTGLGTDFSRVFPAYSIAVLELSGN